MRKFYVFKVKTVGPGPKGNNGVGFASEHFAVEGVGLELARALFTGGCLI